MPADEHVERLPRPADGRVLWRARGAAPVRGPRLTLTPPDCVHCGRLAGIQRTDTLLREQLRHSPDYPAGLDLSDGVAFSRSLRAWCEHRHGVPYAILGPDADPVGLIALWGLEPGAPAGTVGFWLGSAAWGHSYGGEALALLVRHAVGLRLERFEGRVPRVQRAAWRAWSRLGARVSEDASPGIFRCALDATGHGFDAALAAALRGGG